MRFWDPASFLFNHFFKDYSGLPSSPRCVCPVCFGFVQCHDHDVIKGFSLRCPILLRKTKFLHYSFTFSRYSITRSLMSLKWCSHPASFRHILVFNISWEFVSSDFYKKKRRSLTIFNNPDEECFISLRLSSAGVYIACVYRTLSLKWATGASALRCLLACFDPWWVGEPPESFFL